MRSMVVKLCFLFWALSLGFATSGWCEDGKHDVDLLGVWQSIGTEGLTETLEITQTHVAVAIDNKLHHIEPLVGRSGETLIRHNYRVMRSLPSHVHLDGDRLTLTTQDPGASSASSIQYQRFSKRPDFFDLKPFALGVQKDLDASRIEKIQNEFSRRQKLDQEVRQDFDPNDKDQLRRMEEVDRENTAFLREIVAEIGWIDAQRFGSQVALGAFLMVQHSGELDLMLAALPELKRASDEGGNGHFYALLYDRLQLRLGRLQRYGSQIGPDEEGVGQAVLPLEDPEGVDERRRALGMEPLADYMARFGEGISIRRAF